MTPGPRRSAWWFRSAISLLLGVALGAWGACDEPCGGLAAPSPAQATLVTAMGQSYEYGEFGAELAGDCPTPTNMRGSMTISGKQVGSGFAFSLCLRNETLVKSGVAIALDDADAIQVVDVSALGSDGCTYMKDAAAPNPTGTVVFAGFCTRTGVTYDMTISGSIAGIRTCPSDAGPPSSENTTLTMGGTVSVAVVTGN